MNRISEKCGGYRRGSDSVAHTDRGGGIQGTSQVDEWSFPCPGEAVRGVTNESVALHNVELFLNTHAH